MKKLILLLLTGFPLTAPALHAEYRYIRPEPRSESPAIANPFPYGSAAYWDWEHRHYGWYGYPDFGSKSPPLISPGVPLLHFDF